MDISASTRKKPASSSTNDDETTQKLLPAIVLFKPISEDVWLHVASHLSPPDVYNLCLTSRRFFSPSGIPDISTTQREQQQEEEPPVVATRMLRKSLLSSLARVLEYSDSGLTLDSVLGLAELPTGSVLISGSTMVQACLGVLWENPSRRSYRSGPRGTDVDVFCSCKAAPAVRSWLVENGSMFCGWNDTYGELCDGRFLYTVDTKIHHVEHYGSLEANAKENGEDFESYQKETSEWGEDCQQNYVRMKWHFDPAYRLFGIDVHDPDYHMKPLAGGDFPFDFNGSDNIDLVIAKKGEEVKPKATGKRTNNKKKKQKKKKKSELVELTPFDILEDFDLNICKASFDGKKFHIPDPHRTFAGKTTMEPIRKTIAESYVKNFKASTSPCRMEYIERAHLARDTVNAVKRDIKLNSSNCSFFKHVDWADTLPDMYTGDAFSLFECNVQAKHGPYVQFHNWTAKLVNRLRKYQERGIEVVDAPVIDPGIHLPQVDLMPHGG